MVTNYSFVRQEIALHGTMVANYSFVRQEIALHGTMVVNYSFFRQEIVLHENMVATYSFVRQEIVFHGTMVATYSFVRHEIALHGLSKPSTLLLDRKLHGAIVASCSLIFTQSRIIGGYSPNYRGKRWAYVHFIRGRPTPPL